MQYGISKFNKGFRYFLAALLIIGGCCLFIIPIQNNNSKPVEFVLGTLLLVAAFVIIADTTKKLLVIDDQGITLTGLFTNRSLYFNAIKGFKIISGKTTVLIIVPLTGDSRNLRITSDFEKFGEIKDQLKAKITDLDEAAYEQEKEQILSNENFGSTAEEREANIKKAQQFARILIIVSGLLFFILLIVGYYDLVIIPFVLLILLVSFYFIWRFKGLIQIYDNNRKSAYPVIGISLLLAVGSFVLITIKGFGTVCNYDNFWKPAAFTFFITAIIVFWACQKALSVSNAKIGSIVMLIIFLGAFSFSTVISIDKYLDKSTAKQYTVIVMDKSVQVSSKGHRSYWLQLPAWGIMDTKQTQVSKTFYDEVEAGDSIHVLFKEGKLGIPWYDLSH